MKRAGASSGAQLAGALDHRRRHIEPQRLALRRDAVGEVEGRVAAAATDIENEFAGFRVGELEQPFGDRPQERVMPVVVFDPAPSAFVVPVFGLRSVGRMNGRHKILPFFIIDSILRGRREGLALRDNDRRNDSLGLVIVAAVWRAWQPGPRFRPFRRYSAASGARSSCGSWPSARVIASATTAQPATARRPQRKPPVASLIQPIANGPK